MLLMAHKKSHLNYKSQKNKQLEFLPWKKQPRAEEQKAERAQNRHAVSHVHNTDLVVSVIFFEDLQLAFFFFVGGGTYHLVVSINQTI